MLAAAAELLRERGESGVTIDAVLTRSGAPRGSVYHHFPDGRRQMLREALQLAGDQITATIGPDADASGVALLHHLADMWRAALLDSDFAAGSPVLAAAVGSGTDEQQHLTSVAGDIFRRWQAATRDVLVREGFDHGDATALAHTIISAFEGAVVLCRATRSTAPLDDVEHQMDFLVRARAFVAGELAGQPGRAT